VEVTSEAAEHLREINDIVELVAQHIQDVSSGSEEQSRGINQINDAIREIESVTQSSVANSEQNASACQNLGQQAREMRAIVRELMQLVGKEQTSPGGATPAGRQSGRSIDRNQAVALPERRRRLK
jgi:methyl-accepting chemotaxis protein